MRSRMNMKMITQMHLQKSEMRKSDKRGTSMSSIIININENKEDEDDSWDEEDDDNEDQDELEGITRMRRKVQRWRR